MTDNVSPQIIDRTLETKEVDNRRLIVRDNEKKGKEKVEGEKNVKATTCLKITKKRNEK